MRSLLDVNVLIALLDADHTLHEPAISWFAKHGRGGWASCPLTQNGCVRIMANPSYPNALPVEAVIRRLADASRNSTHEFWPDDVSLLDARIADPTRILTSSQLTDLYLLALAVAHGGRFVSFDKSISFEPILGARPQHLLRL
ncbi:MAG TPA: TA system VapC family ribonuclease toxin [Steroidobacteraceae bacterium]|nr:TA system VapC family ribonuclease toxin [Steroidobacteraceae bacterium]